MIVQIYEIQTPEEAETCIKLGVDHVGSVLLPEADWRQPKLKETLKVSQGTRAKNSLISLIQDSDTLYKVLDYYQPDFIHFCESLTDGHGREIDLDRHVSLQGRIKEAFPEVGIMRSVPIPKQGSTLEFPTLRIARKLEPVSDLFLTDTWLEREPIAGFIGITGRRCDWKMAKELVLRAKIPVILAGGLSPENVYSAVIAVDPAGADSCTQTNRRDKDGSAVRFSKDFDRVKGFVEEVRRAEQSRTTKNRSQIQVPKKI